MLFALLDDEEADLNALEYALSSESLGLDSEVTIHRFSRGLDLIAAIKRENYDLIFLDWNIPDIGGDEVLIWLRSYQKQSPPPVLMLTNRNSESDVVRALEMGASEYLVKPFRSRELAARVRKILSLTQPIKKLEVETSRSFGNIKIDAGQRSCTVDGVKVELTEIEFLIVQQLFQNIGQSVSRQHLMSIAWGKDDTKDYSRSLDVFIFRVRRKLKLSVEHGWALHTIYGYGYRLDKLEPV